MVLFSDLLKSHWYGETNSGCDIAVLRESFEHAMSDREKLMLITELLKLGDFSVKADLLQIMNITKDEEVLRVCIRLFCLVASHKDLLISENLLFLSDVSENNADTFAAASLYTLSYDVIPYLLAMLEEWEDTNVAGTIRNSLDIFLNYSDHLDEDATVEEIGNYYVDFLNDVVEEHYYYYSTPVFPGKLTKQIIEKSVNSLNTSVPIRTNVIPTLLSVWSGIKCPVQFDTIVDSKILEDIYQYAEMLSKMDWETGIKYFYGHRVV